MNSAAWTRPVVVSAAAAAVAVLAGCGSSSSSTIPTGTLSARPTASTGPPATSARTDGTAPSAADAASQAPVPVESNPPGDIPDSVAYVVYRNAAGGYQFTYPEGWARTETAAQVTFTDKLNGIAVDTTGLPATLDVAAVRQQELPRLQQSQAAFELRTIEAVSLPAGRGVKVVYRRNSAPDPVTGRQIRAEVESYLVGSGTRQVRLDLFGPVGADNVDAYRTISRSLALA